MNPTQTTLAPAVQASFVNAANQSTMVRGIAFAYRDTGPAGGVPLVLPCWSTAIRRVSPPDYRGLRGQGPGAP